MPKQNRPVVRDGRIQVKKKRTDRSYLGVDDAASGPAVVDIVDDAAGAGGAAAPSPDPTTAFSPPATPPVEASPVPTSAPMPAASAAARAAGAARALQQQGIQKRRGVDLNALARRDTSYALHELRRIGVLAAMVVTTLIVLGVFLR